MSQNYDCDRMMNDLRAVLERLVSGDYSARLALSGDRHEFDAVARVVNSLAEETQAAKAGREAASEQLVRLVTASPVVVYSCGLERPCSLSFISENLPKVFGLEPKAVLAETQGLAARVHPDDLAEVLALRSRLPDLGQVRSEYRLRLGDGSWRWVQDLAVLVRGADGHPAEVVGTLLDIDERRRAEQALREKEEELGAVLEASPEGIGIINTRTGLFENPNRQAEELFGLPGAALEKLGPEQVSPELQPSGRRSAELAREHIDAALAGERPVFEWETLAADGRLVPCEIRLVALPPPRQHVVRFSITDVSARRQAEQTLVEREAEARTIQDCMHAGLLIIDPETHTIVDANRLAARMFGKPKEEIIGRVCHKFVCPAAAGRCPITDLGKTVDNSERELLTGGGQRTRVLKTVVEVSLRGRRHLLESFVDISELKEAEAAVVRSRDELEQSQLEAIRLMHEAEAQRNRAQAMLEELTRSEEELRRAKDAAETSSRSKSLFLANMSHEIRTPMNAVLGFSQLLLRDPETTPSQRQHLQTITRAGDHLLSLIDDILQIAKIEAGRITVEDTTFDLHRLLGDIELTFAERCRGKGLWLRVEGLAALPPHVVSDETKLRQVLVNLLGNAVKFTQRGGIMLRAAQRESEQGRRLVLEVEDTGPGIGPEELPRLFQKFEQTESGRRSKKGTGLGLAISRELARLMGGDLTVTSQPGRGSVFRLELPLRVGRADEVREDAAHKVRRLVGSQLAIRVLVVDDEEDNRVFLTTLLGSVGFEVRQASNGAEAVEVFRDWHPQLVLMDKRMPVLDGIEATRRIRAAPGGATARIIIVTASAFEEDRAEACTAGADDFVSKPFREAALFERIQALLGVSWEHTNTRPAVPAASAASEEARVARLPLALADKIRQATRSADLDEVLALLEQVQAHDAPAAARLRELAEQFAYKQILAMLPEPGAAA